jgi:hypothetical protein
LSVSAAEGEDPPDLYLTIGASRVAVEVTRLSQFTLEPDGTLGNRATQDSFGIRLIDDLNDKIGPSLPDGISLLVSLWVPISRVARFRKSLTCWVESVAAAPAGELRHEREIEGSKVSISVIPERPSGKKIVGIVANTNTSADIGLNARLVLEDRIYTKSEICSTLPKPIWLAVLNDYWLADADTYAAASRQIKLAHCFERIFLVSIEGSVSEITVRA